MTAPSTQFFILSFSFITLTLFSQIDPNYGYQNFDSNASWIEEVKQLRLSDPESTIALLQGGVEHFLNEKDSLSAISALLQIAGVHGHLAEYPLTYQALWQAMFLADQYASEAAQVPVLIELGLYSSFYKRKEKSIAYYNKALEISKRLLGSGQDIDSSMVAQCYYAMCATYRDFNEPELARVYIDSCYKYQTTTDVEEHRFLQFEETHQDYVNGEFEVAKQRLNDLKPWFQENRPGFLVLLNSKLGDVHLELGDDEAAERAYRSAVAASEKYNSHFDFSPILYKQLANIYVLRKDYFKAYEAIKEEQRLNTTFFDSRSESNIPLLQIKDEYQLEKRRQNQLIQKQRIAQLEYEDRLGFLQNIILVGTIVFLILGGLLYLNTLRKKHSMEKEMMRKQKKLEMKQNSEFKELEIKKTRELLELKNKELSVSALKLIEKNNFIEDLRSMLRNKGNIDVNEIKKIVNRASSETRSIWEEFEMRFVSVNKDFYNNLKHRHPNLTQGDLKISALLKLNFSSKDMSNLLGISVESVHTTRYRLRKKMNLSRDVNLTEYIARI